MTVTKYSFGVTRAGAPVTAYRMENKTGASVTVLDYGATVQSLCVPDRTGRLVDVVLGYDTIGEYEENDGFLGATVGRVCNRIGGASFSLSGKTYSLAKTIGAHHLHGGVRGFDKYIWLAEPVAESLRFSRLSPDGEEGYPGNLTVTVTFRLTEDNCLVVTYDGDTDRDTIVNLTNHSYFNLNGGGTALDHRLQLFAQQMTENSPDSVPTGRILPVEDTPFDFRAGKTIRQDIGAENEQLRFGGGYDHNYVLSGPTAAHLTGDKSGIRLTVTTTMPGVQLYTANSLTERTGKGGVTLRPRDAVCLETQLFPDGMAHYGFPSPVLRAGEHLHSETGYAFTLA